MPCMFQEWHACGMNGMHVFNETYACACVDQSNASVMNAMPECACKTKAPTEVVIVHHLSSDAPARQAKLAVQSWQQRLVLRRKQRETWTSSRPNKTKK